METDSVYRSVRAWIFGRGEIPPTAEEFLVTAPGFVKDKQQDRFEAIWTAHTGWRAPRASRHLTPIREWLHSVARYSHPRPDRRRTR